MNKLKKYNKNKFIKIFYTILFIILIIISMIVTEFDFGKLIENFGEFTDLIVKMLPPISSMSEFKEYFSYSSEIFPELIKTLQMAVLGTLIGTTIAFPVAIIASVNISNKYVSFTTKLLLSITRTLPVLIYAMVLTYVFGLGEMAGVIAISIFSFGIVTKMLYEIIERIDMGAYEAAISNGISRYNAFNLTIIPQILPAFYSSSLYTFEINVKSATILGYVGAGGIGKQLQDAMAFKQYDRVGLILFYTIILVIVIDSLSQYIRKEMI